VSAGTFPSAEALGHEVDGIGPKRSPRRLGRDRLWRGGRGQRLLGRQFLLQAGRQIGGGRSRGREDRAGLVGVEFLLQGGSLGPFPAEHRFQAFDLLAGLVHFLGGDVGLRQGDDGRGMPLQAGVGGEQPLGMVAAGGVGTLGQASLGRGLESRPVLGAVVVGGLPRGLRGGHGAEHARRPAQDPQPRLDLAEEQADRPGGGRQRADLPLVELPQPAPRGPLQLEQPEGVVDEQAALIRRRAPRGDRPPGMREDVFGVAHLAVAIGVGVVAGEPEEFVMMVLASGAYGAVSPPYFSSSTRQAAFTRRLSSRGSLPIRGSIASPKAAPIL